MTFQPRPKGGEEQTRVVPGRGVIWSEGKAGAKVVRRECAWWVQGAARRLEWLEQDEQGDVAEGGGVRGNRVRSQRALGATGRALALMQSETGAQAEFQVEKRHDLTYTWKGSLRLLGWLTFTLSETEMPAFACVLTSEESLLSCKSGHSLLCQWGGCSEYLVYHIAGNRKHPSQVSKHSTKLSSKEQDKN